MAGCISLLKTIYDSDLIKNDIPNNMNIYEYIIICMYNDINKDTADWPQFSQKAKTFGDEYSKLLNNNDFDTDDSSHRTLLSSLSTDYDNFKRYCGEHALVEVFHLFQRQKQHKFLHISQTIHHQTIFKKKIKKNNEENE
ncbi:CIR protein PIR protein [Plasmodium vinckei brucechwatti]|uniref:CIR protein PIR protein n=1 Tax=Plasmodium vinckei brucechwatti TaxID=119398 RepID=A0A6V7SV49_PLAVN|nr:CIR protein PIR protein [Plasmodium vinckei brucechwatti]